ncbi:MAG: Gfo/Idh/MocA family protein, partial [Methanosarcinales archaeon]
MVDKLKVAIVGNGNICNLAHIPAWKSIKEAEVVATCDIIEEKAKKACIDLGAKEYYTSIDDLLGNDNIDLVDLCVPTHEHANLAIKALESGKHVICEKPISNNLQSAKLMISAAKKNGNKLYIAHTRRFDPRLTTIKESIDSGKIGTPIYIRRCERSYLPFPKDMWHWDTAKSGGVLLDIGIHCADLVRWLLDSEPIEVFAKGKTIREEAKEMNCYDLGVAMILFEENKNAVIEASWAHPKTYAPFYSELDIVGTKGKIEYSDKKTNPMMVVNDHVNYPRYSPLVSSMLESFCIE